MGRGCDRGDRGHRRSKAEKTGLLVRRGVVLPRYGGLWWRWLPSGGRCPLRIIFRFRRFSLKEEGTVRLSLHNPIAENCATCTKQDRQIVRGSWKPGNGSIYTRSK